MLFLLTNFVIMCYSAIENEYRLYQKDIVTLRMVFNKVSQFIKDIILSDKNIEAQTLSWAMFILNELSLPLCKLL